MRKISFSLLNYNCAINKLYNEVSDYLHMQDDLLKHFPPIRVSHTGTNRWLTKPFILEAPYKLHTNKAIGEIETFTKTDVIKFKEFLHNLIIPIRNKAKEHTIEIINQTCDATGNKVNVGNQDVWDAYIEALEKVEMIFDSYGNPNFLIYSPEMDEKRKRIEPTIEQKNRIEEIFKQKIDAYFLKKGLRKLTKSKRKTKRIISEINVDVNLLKINLSLPKYESSMTQLFRDVKNGYEMLDPILSEIQSIPVAHDGAIRQVSEPNVLETSMRDYSIEELLELNCFRKTDSEYFRDFLWRMIEKVSGELKKHLFETVSQTCDAVGNSVDAKGKNFWDSYNEMLETTDMSFDENGNHNYKIYVHPDTAREIETNNPPTEEQLAKGKEIIERKKKEYYAQKRTRRLFKLNN